MAAVADEEQEEEVVIAGAGIAGLATAVALKRMGIRCLVLEKSPTLRDTGAALTLFPNAWRVLAVLGVAHKLTPLYRPFRTSRVTNLHTGATQEFLFAGTQDCDMEGMGVRAVHRKALVEALAQELPPEAIRFSSKLISINTVESRQDSSQVATLRLDDGSVIRAKVVIGCDGVSSVVAQWLGLTKPVQSGRSAVRGLAFLPEGHGCRQEVRQYLKDGKRAGFIPLNDKEIYWFFVDNSTPSEEQLPREPELILQQLMERHAEDFPVDFLTVVRHSDPTTLTWAPLVLRVPWDLLLGRTHRGCVTVAGDAMHPMTPDLAQGGCTALEDAVVLARHIGWAVARRPDGIAGAVAGYVKERRWRVARLIAAAYITSCVQQSGTGGLWRSLVGWFRDKIFYRFIFPQITNASRHDCGGLDHHLN